MNNISPDFVDESMFKRSSKNVSQIQFGEEWLTRSDKNKIEYLIKLASSLNHAAAQIQKERDVLNDMLFGKERQLTACMKSRDQDREMMQKQLFRENKTKQVQAERLQTMSMEKKELRAEIKRLSDDG